MARSFNGSSDRLDNASTLVSAEPFTMACWFNVDTTVDHCLMSIADKDVTNQQHRLIAAGSIGGADLLTASTFDGTLSTANSSTTYAGSAWQHACGVWASTSSRTIYLNGGNSGSNTDSRSVTGIDRATIGVTADSTPVAWVNGSVAEAAIWNVALTAAETQILSAGYSPLFVRPQSLVAYWPLIGNTSPEISPVGGFDMTITGATKAAHPRVIRPSAQIISFPTAAPAGRIMSSLANHGGLAGKGGIAGIGGGLAN